MALSLNLLTRKKISHYEHLRKKWTERHHKLSKQIQSKHKTALHWLSDNTKQITAGSLGGLMLLTAPNIAIPPSQHASYEAKLIQNIDKNIFLISDLSRVLPDNVGELNSIEEEKVASILSKNFGFKVSATLEGKRLNRSYGIIGAEQHLARYPGDTMATHFDTREEASRYYSSGMAPGLGAWRYFAQSRAALTEKEKDRERFYIAVQTFLSPNFLEKVREYIQFYKFRKMLVVNPENGRGIVVVIGDAGPAVWTGKHLGGSPEVMKYLGRVDGAGKGPVLYFFIDDPEDTVSLGPISVVQ